MGAATLSAKAAKPVSAALQLRPARAEDCRALSELGMRSKAYWGYPPDFMAACREELRVRPDSLEAPGWRYVVARSGKQLVGYYALVRLDDSRVELDALFLEPACIGIGFGRRLFAAACADAAAMPADTLLIQADPHALRFYEAAGATKVGERESGSVPGRMLPVLLRPLQAVAGGETHCTKYEVN